MLCSPVLVQCRTSVVLAGQSLAHVAKVGRAIAQAQSDNRKSETLRIVTVPVATPIQDYSV